MSVDATKVLTGIALGEFHRSNALKQERLFDLEANYFAALSDEVHRLIATNAGSDPQQKGHPSSASSEPYGGITQFSLLNATGDFDDISTDHNNATTNKWFHHGAEYPAIARLAELLPPVFNLRINVLPPKAGFTPHQEQVSYRDGRAYIFRGRFHLPIQTNPGAVLLLEDDLYHFDAGSIYYFNNGCNHSAENRGDDVRIHILFDMPLTKSALETMFGNEDVDELRRTPLADRFPAPVGHVKIDDVLIQGHTKKWYDRLHLKSLGISQRRWNDAYSTYRYGRFAVGGRVNPFPPVTSTPR